MKQKELEKAAEKYRKSTTNKLYVEKVAFIEGATWNQKNNEVLLYFIKDIATNWDCDSDAHRYNTTCRACEAAKLLKQLKS